MKKIETIFAFIMEDNFAFIMEDNDMEGIPSALLNGMHYPLIGADEARVASFRKLAQKIADATRKEVRLVRFHTPELLETIKPCAR